MIIKKIGLLILSFILTGCVIPQKVNKKFLPRCYEYNSSHHHEVTVNLPENGGGVDSPVFLSCYNTTNHRYDGNPKVATKTYKYALMASNSYHSEASFVIPNWTLKKHYRGKRTGRQVGFQADQYENKLTKEIALVFRGTDSSKDHKANFAMWWPWSHSRVPAQYQLARNLAEKIYNENKENPDFKLILIGHSLGGGLAFHASWNIPKVKTYAFDPSPRVWSKGKLSSGERYVVRERGEVLQYIQFWNSLPVDKDKDEKFNFISGSATREHNMYYLARGLLLMAAQNGDIEAKTIMDINLNCKQYNKE